ncbi:sugar phosphate isomerase/epimerase [bacterium]|nr:sugar phosphate isomerase/epimerase [bacterium]
MKEFGVQYAELRSVWGRNILDMGMDELQRVKNVLQDNGLKVSCIASPLFKCHLFQEDKPLGDLHLAKERSLDEQWEILHRSLQLAHFFNAPIVRTFSFWRIQEPTVEIFQRIAPYLKRAAEEAEKEGLILALENEHSCFAGSGEETATLLSLIDSPYLKVIWDPGNAFFAGEVPYPDGYEKVKDYIVHIHIKDARLNKQTNQPEWALIGEGEIDFPAQFQRLKEEGYDGVVSLETHLSPPKESSRLALQRLSAMI